MASIYSTRFALITSSSAGPTTLYTVPTGFKAIVRDVSGLASAAPAGLAVGVNAAESFFSGLSLSNLESFHWEGRVVLNAGDTLALFVLAGTVQLVVSGYLLDA